MPLSRPFLRPKLLTINRNPEPLGQQWECSRLRRAGGEDLFELGSGFLFLSFGFRVDRMWDRAA